MNIARLGGLLESSFVTSLPKSCPGLKEIIPRITFSDLALERKARNAAKIAEQILNDPQDFFSYVSKDKHLVKEISKDPMVKKLVKEFGQPKGEVYPEVYAGLKSHNEGMIKYYQKFCDLLGINNTEKQLEQVKVAVYAHDAGKVEGPLAKWNAKGRPDEHGMYLITEHPHFSGLISDVIGADELTKTFAYGHHSKVGQMETRLVNARIDNCVRMAERLELAKACDIFEALTATDRPYRDRMLNWLEVFKFYSNEFLGRKRLDIDGFMAGIRTVFGDHPTKQTIYNKLQENVAQGIFDKTEMIPFLRREYRIDNTKLPDTTSLESTVELAAEYLHLMAS